MFLGIVIAFLIFWVGLILLKIKNHVAHAEYLTSLMNKNVIDFWMEFIDFKKTIATSTIDSEAIDGCLSNLRSLNNQTYDMARNQKVIHDDTSHMARILELMHDHIYRMARKRR
jgi:hypothetical protein